MTIHRDRSGRITAIKDPGGESLTYQYAAGDLVKAVDRVGNAVTFTYDTTTPHYLVDVIDPLGRVGVRSEYDEHGRLVGQQNPEGGSSISLEQQLDNGLTRLVYQDGSEEFVRYDSLGRVTETIDAAGNSTRHEYGANGLTKLTNALGEETRYGAMLAVKSPSWFTRMARRLREPITAKGICCPRRTKREPRLTTNTTNLAICFRNAVATKLRLTRTIPRVR